MHNPELAAPPPLLSPELARTDPESFKSALLAHMGATTELGAQAWNAAVDAGTVDPAALEINPDTWASFSRASTGYVSIGAAPMAGRERSRYLYLGEQMSYADEVSRRLLHEVTHGGVFTARDRPNMNALLRMALALRNEGGPGLTSLGNHPHYATPDERAIEDVVELVTMREVSEDHLAGYLRVLSDDRHAPVRAEVGLARIDPSDAAGFEAVIDAAAAECLAPSR